MKKYNHKTIEKKWQKLWERDGLYTVKNSAKGKENYYTLVEFPYPSGNLHIGHWYAFAVPDIFARYKRMQGFNVLFPIGFDSFGLPAENAAIKNNVDPKEWTGKNIKTMEKQLRSIGASFDWSREIITSDSSYYRWTQHLFLELYKKGLAYQGEAVVNWDPVDMTVLANEQVLPDGTAERSGAVVQKKKLTQWFLKITDYAERLLQDLDGLAWPEEIKQSQKNWIGRSHGALITFELRGSQIQADNNADERRLESIRENLGANLRGSATSIEVFTTRPDTLFGATYLVLAPEHEQISNLKSQISNWKEVEHYIETAKKKKEIERIAENKEKTGIMLEGVMAINPATKKEIPIFIADYVLADYGTGAIMAVPAHDERDLAFAEKHNLPVLPVILKSHGENRSFVMGVSEDALKSFDVSIIEKTKSGFFKITIPFERIEEYKEFIRKHMEPHFWNEFSTSTGFHFIFKHKDGTLEEYELSEKTNDIIDKYGATFNDKKPSKEPQNVYAWLAKNSFYKELLIHSHGGVLINSGKFSGLNSEEAKKKITEFVGGKMKTTYKLRDWLISRQRYWGCPIPIVYDLEGKPHPVPEKNLPWLLPEDVDWKPSGKPPLASSKELHQRTLKLFGKGWRPEYDTLDVFMDSSWYFLRYADPENKKEFASKDALTEWMPVRRYSGGAEHTTVHLLYSRFFHKALFDLGLVNEPEPFLERFNRGIILGTDGRKMSKRWGNVIDPDAQVEMVGADSIRLYLAFIAPYNTIGHHPWDVGGVVGVRRFLERVWKLHTGIKNNELGIRDDDLETLLHQTIKKVGEDIASFKFNTAVSQMMIFLNSAEKFGISKKDFEIFLTLLAPFAPHLAEELWEMLGKKSSIHQEVWPRFDENKMREKEYTLVVQVNGKVRDTFVVPADTSSQELERLAFLRDTVVRWTQGKKIGKVIHVKGRLLNILIA